MFRSARRRLPRIGRWPRLCAAGVCLLFALTNAVGAKGTGTDAVRTAAVVVARHDLPAGHRLRPADLAVSRWPARLRPAAARADPRALVGQRLAGPVGGLEAITSNRVLGRGLMQGLADGLVAATVSLDDPHTAELVRSGDRVDVLATPRPPEFGAATPGTVPKVSTLVERAQVLAVLPKTDDSDAELVLAVDRNTAVRMNRERSAQLLTVIVDPP
jgi:pilus assembly protein CpaB